MYGYKFRTNLSLWLLHCSQTNNHPLKGDRPWLVRVSNRAVLFDRLIIVCFFLDALCDVPDNFVVVDRQSITKAFLVDENNRNYGNSEDFCESFGDNTRLATIRTYEEFELVTHMSKCCDYSIHSVKAGGGRV